MLGNNLMCTGVKVEGSVLYEFACTCKQITFVSFSSGENSGDPLFDINLY